MAGPRCGMLEPQVGRVQKVSAYSRIGATVSLVADDRVSYRGEMHPDLMRSACLRPHVDERAAPIVPERSIQCGRRTAIIDNRHLLPVVGVASYGSVNDRLSRIRVSCHQSQVSLLDLSLIHI